MLEINSGLQAKTIFDYLQHQYVGCFSDGQLRTLQREIKVWRATEGPPKEVFFSQVHVPGELAQSDFTNMNKLNITILGAPFNHLLYHFVLTYSNWETGSICFSESFEALSEGLQNALWKLGGVPKKHRSDRLSTAVVNLGSKKEFTQRYQALLNHYHLLGQKINVACPNENGDIEQSHHRFKTAVDQACMLRGSRDFLSVDEYKAFLQEVFAGRNAGRKKRFFEEQKSLRKLPMRRQDALIRQKVRVSLGSTINVKHNTYSVPSRLIGATLDVYVFADHLKIYYGQKLVEQLPRLRGRGKHHLNYRHIVDSLLRKPGAFANYRYRAEMFPSITFRLAYDCLKKSGVKKADHKYLLILKLAARASQSKVEIILRDLIDRDIELSAGRIKDIIESDALPKAAKIEIAPVNLLSYDRLLRNAVI